MDNKWDSEKNAGCSPEMTRDWKSGRHREPASLAGIGGLLVLGLSATFLPLERSPSPPRRELSALPWVKDPQPAAPEAPAQSHLPLPLESASRRMSIEEFAGALARTAPEPVARRAAEAFRKEPALRGAYEDFLGVLAKRPDFRRLMNQSIGDPGAKAAFTRAERDRDLGPVLRSVLAASGVPSAPPAPGPARSAQSLTRGVSLSQGPPRMADLGDGGAPLLAENAPAAAGSQGSSSPGIQGGKGETAAGHGGGRAEEPGGAGAHEVDPKLSGIVDASNERMTRFCGLYPFLCDGDTVKPEFRPLFDDNSLIGSFGLWGACFSLDIYGKCKDACASDPECVAMDCWQSCLDWKNNDVTQCIPACQTAYAQPGAAPAAIQQEPCSTKMCPDGEGAIVPSPPPPGASSSVSSPAADGEGGTVPSPPPPYPDSAPPLPGDRPVCNPDTQPFPHWGVRDGICQKSCGNLGGIGCHLVPCALWGEADIGISYDCPYCCK